MIRKALAVLCSLSLILTSVGAGVVSAQSNVQFTGQRAIVSGNQLIIVPAGRAIQQDMRLDRETLRRMRLPAETKQRLLQLYDNVAPYVNDSAYRTPEAEAAILKFYRQANDPKANQEVVLADLFDGLAHFAVKVGELTNTERVTRDDGVERVVKEFDARNRKVREVYSKKLGDGVRYIEIYRPAGPKSSERQVLDQVAFTYLKDGVPQQKIVWSRRMLQAAKQFEAYFYARGDIKDQLDDPTVSEDDKKTLQADLDYSQGKYNQDKMGDVLTSLEAGQKNIGVLKRAILAPEDIERLSKKLQDDQFRLQKFYNVQQLDSQQKMLLAQMIQYLSQNLGLNYDPFRDKKGGKEGGSVTTMSMERVQECLNDFERGSYGDYGLLTRFTSKVLPWYSAVDPEKDMPPALKAYMAAAVRYLGHAMDARRRMEAANGAGRLEERAVAMEELGHWIQLAGVQLQSFEIYSNSKFLENFRNGNLPSDIRLREEDAGEAWNLITAAREQVLPKYGELALRTERSILKQVLASFSTSLQDSRYMNLSADILKEKLAILAAQVKEMRSLYLARRFRAFAAEPRHLAEYRLVKNGDSKYYAGKAEGLFDYFYKNIASFDSKAYADLKVFDEIAGRIERIPSGDPDDMRQALSPVEGRLAGLYAVLEMPAVPSPEEAQKTALRLAAFQNGINGAVGNFSQKLQMFSAFHQLDLYVEKYASSSNLEETRANNRLTRFIEMRWMDPAINTGGGRDTLGNWASAVIGNILGKDFHSVLGTEEQRARRAEIRSLMRLGDYDGAYREIAQIDPMAAEKAWIRYNKLGLERFEDVGFDMESLLTQSPRDRQGVLTQASIGGAFKHLSGYMFSYMFGSAIADFGVMAVAMPYIGAGLAAATRIPAAFASRLALGVQKFRSAKNLGRALALAQRNLQFSSRALEKSLRFSERLLNGMSKNVLKRFGIPPNLKLIFNRVAYRDAMVAAGKFSVRETMVLGSAGVIMQTFHHWAAGDTSSSRSYGEAAGMGFLGSAIYAVKGGWMFALMPPSSAIHGKGAFARYYRGLGESAGPVNWASWGVAKLFGKWWKPATTDLGVAGKAASAIPGRWWAKQMWENPLGVWGYVMEKVQGMRPAQGASGVATFKAVSAQKAAGAAAYVGMFTDGAFKFMLITEGVREAMQGGTYAYHWLKDKFVPREQGESDPSAHFQRLVHAHRAGLSSMQIAFLLIPTPGYNEPRSMERQQEAMAVSRAIYEKGGKEINRFLATTADGTGVVNTKIKWHHSFWSFWRRVIEGKKTADSPATSEQKQWLAARVVEKMSLEQLFVLKSLPPVEKDAAGRLVYTNASGKKELWMYYQEFLRFGELSRISAGEKVVPSLRWREGNKITNIPEGEDVIFLIPETNDAAAVEINKRLVNSPDLVARIMSADPAAGNLVLNLGPGRDFEVKNPEMIKNIQSTVKWAAYDPGAAALETAVLSEMRQKMSGTAAKPDELPFDPKELAPIFDRIWDPQVKKLSDPKLGPRNNNFAKAAGMVREVVRGKLLIEALNDYVQLSAGKFANAPQGEASRAAIRIARAFDEILKLGGVINPRTLRPMDPLRVGQKRAIAKFIKEFLVSENPDSHAIRTFIQLYASGGKTLVIKLAVIPTLSLRTRYRYKTTEGGVREAELIPEKQRRKVRFITSNETLTRQFIEDWKSYSGGQSPEFKVTSLSEFQFEELFRKERGEPSLGSEETLIMDEADFFFGHPSVMVGEPNGHLSWGHPILEALMRMSSKMMGRVRSGELQGLGDAQRAQVYREVAKEFKAELRAAARSLKNDRSATREMRDETKNFFKVIQEEFGRMEFGGDVNPKGKNWWGVMKEYVANRRQGQGVVGRVFEWLRDDGLGTFLYKQADFMYEAYSKADPTLDFIPKGDSDTPLDNPTHAGTASPTLATPHRIARTLARFNELRAENKVPADVPLRLDLPLRSQADLTLAEIFHRLKEGGADIVLLSGTAANRVKDFLKSQEFTFLNESFATKMPDRTQVLIDGGRLSLAPHEVGKTDENGNRVLANPELLRAKNLNEDPAYGKIRVDTGKVEYGDVETVRLAVYLTRKTLEGGLRDFLGSKKSRPLGQGSLVHLTPRTLQEAQVWRQTLIDNGVVKENEIVSFLPDYVHKGYSELRLREMFGENNVDALETGEAKVVLNVPAIGGRGVDLPFKMYQGQIAVIGVHTHSVPIVEDIQVKNRTGHGRISEQDRIEYVDITSAYALKTDVAKEGYMKSLEPLVWEVVNPKGPAPRDPIARQLKKIIDSEGYDPVELRKFGSDSFKGLAARGDVYWLMQPMLQEEAQIRANESSGIIDSHGNLRSFEEAFSAEDVNLLSGGVSAIVWAGTSLGLGWGMVPVGIASFASNLASKAVGSLALPKDQRHKVWKLPFMPEKSVRPAASNVPLVDVDPAMLERLRAAQSAQGLPVEGGASVIEAGAAGVQTGPK